MSSRKSASREGVAASGTLYYGDNLSVLQSEIDDESIDLIYLDPPFNSSAQYNVIFEERDGSGAQAGAFHDTWTWTDDSERGYESVMKRGGPIAETLSGMMSFLGKSNTMSYLCMMTPRLIELRRVLKRTGALYLHCDPTASHFLKIVLDAVFGRENFRNEILWYYYNKMHDSRKRLFPNATDHIFFYVKDVNSDFPFHQLKERRETPIKQLMRKKVNGKIVNARDDSGKLMYQLKEDRTIDNVWRIPMLQPASPERLGWPTQKPLALLERILKASSDEGAVVLDPFCGCGTAVDAAQKLGRRWVGIDVTHYAITVIESRLKKQFKGLTPRVVGRPLDLAGAWDLARRNKAQFQWWANWLVGVQNYREQKGGGDQGIDGKIFFMNGPYGTGRIIVSVKGGDTINPSMVRDLIGTVDSEEAELGLFVCIAEPSPAMIAAAARAGLVKTAHGRFPKVQIITIEELLAGKRANLPPYYEVDGERRTSGRKHPSSGGAEPQLSFKFPISGGRVGGKARGEAIYPSASLLMQGR